MPDATPTVIIIDDSSLVLKICTRILEAAGINVVALDNPFMLQKALAAGRPNLVLLDVNMPGLMGTKLLEFSKSREMLAGIPVVLHSDKEEKDLAALAQSAGAAGYIRKTGDPAHFVAQVRRWIDSTTPMPGA